MPRARSIAIQSEVAPRSRLAVHRAACVIADACSARASVRVDLPASGWLIDRERPPLGRLGRDP